MTARAAGIAVLVALVALAGSRARADDEGLRAELAGGGGLGTRGFVRPTLDGTQRLDAAAFPAADLGFRVEGPAAERLSFAAYARYRTSIGLRVEERPPFALANDVGARCQHLELGIAPTWQLAAGPRSLALAFPVGFAVRTFWAEVHDLATPSYNLAGALLRVELVAPLGDHLTLRAGPELYGLFFVGRVLRDAGVDPIGVAIGGEASLRLALPDPFAVEVAYRESHAFAGHDDDARSFEDVERFATARLVGAL